MSSSEILTQKSAVFDSLATMITELDFPPGSRLIEADLAETLGVSKTPVREALILLQAEKLVELKPYHGATVTWLSLEEYRDIHFLLDAIESPALELVVERLPEAEIKRVGDLINRAKRARESENSLLFGELTTLIHTTLFSVVHSDKLSGLVTAITRRVGRRYARVFKHQFSDAWDIELELIVGRYQGIVQGDAKAAARAMKDGHKRLQELASSRIHHPAVAPYIIETLPDEDFVRVIPIRKNAKR